MTDESRPVYATVIDLREGPPGTLIEFKPFGRDFRFVNRLMEYQEAMAGANAFIVAEYDFTGEEDWAESHFVGEPVMPGNLQQECADQASALMGLLNPKFAGRGFLLTSKENVRFRGIVEPGDTLVIRSELIRLSGHGGKFGYKTWVKDSEPKVWAVSADEMTFAFFNS